MNNEAYTAFPVEREILLMEGQRAFILAVERDVQIMNSFPSFADFNQKTLAIIHLFIANR